jgi:hypothetical protein
MGLPFWLTHGIATVVLMNALIYWLKVRLDGALSRLELRMVRNKGT